MEQTVDDGGGHHLVSKDLTPVGRAPIRGPHNRAALIAPAHDLEDLVRRRLVERQVAELVDAQHGRPGVGAHLVARGALEMSGLQVAHQVSAETQSMRYPASVAAMAVAGAEAADRWAGTPGAHDDTVNSSATTRQLAMVRVNPSDAPLAARRY